MNQNRYRGMKNMLILALKKMSASFFLTVRQIQRLTENAVTVDFTVPPTEGADFAFVAGQYLTLEAEINGDLVRRAYSLCSAPHEESLAVGIKKVPRGKFSSFANDVLKVGDQLRVFPPEGRFTYRPKNNESLLLFAAGSGITPLFSIIKTALNRNDSTHVCLVYGNKTPQDVMFAEELSALQKAFPDRFQLHWVFSQSNEKNALFGRIDASVVAFALNQSKQPPDQAFLCGPEPMILTVKEELLKKNFAEEQIHFELFHSGKKVADEAVSSGEEVSIQLLCDQQEHQLVSTPNKTLLEAALQAKIDVPYSCQGGVCCSCIAKVTQGTAVMENNQVLTDSEIEEGLVLTCQAIPQSKSITVDFDDV